MEFSVNLLYVLSGATLLGAVGGLVGTFTVLRGQSLLGDALAHAALPGVALAFLITGSKHPLPLLLGATVAGVLGSLAMVAVVRGSRIKEDSAIGVVLSVLFGVGIVLLTAIQKMPSGTKAGLDKYLFGQAATLVASDVQVMLVLTVLALLVLLLFYKELKLLAFDLEFGASLGYPMRAIEILLTTLIVVVVVVGLQMVGVVLMVATLVTPAATARQWTQRLGVMLVVAAMVGAFSGASGALASAAVPGLPTGPTIVVIASVLLIASLVLAPEKGMVWRAVRGRRLGARIRRENLLKDLYRLGEADRTWEAPVPCAQLAGARDVRTKEFDRCGKALQKRGLVLQAGDALKLTQEGLVEAQKVVRKHRLWEVYLTHRLDLPEDHVHRDAEDMEHALSDEAVDALEERLGFPDTDPHGKPIPPRRAA